MIPRNVLIHGTKNPLPERKPLTAGPLSMVFESGYVRHLKFGDAEVLRRIYVAVRMHNWVTVLPEIRHLHVETKNDSFEVSFEAIHKFAGVHFEWNGRITGAANGTVIFNMDGEARSNFRSNRIGICVLLPLRESINKACEITTGDGARRKGTFPSAILPSEVFRNIRSLSYEPVSGMPVEIGCEGDIFDMEDQRNWSDGSFKIYSTMFGKNAPVEVGAGTRFSQKVTFKLRNRSAVFEHAHRSNDTTCTRISISSRDVEPFRLGLMTKGDGGALSEKEMARLAAVKPAFLRFDCVFTTDGWENRLRDAGAAASAIGAALQVVLHLTDAAKPELSAVREVLERAHVRQTSVLVLHASGGVTPVDLLKLAREQLEIPGVRMSFELGTDEYFVALNRNRCIGEDAGTVAYSLNPQVHTFDDASLVDNLQGQPWTVRTLKEIFPWALPCVKVTLRPALAIPRDPVAEKCWQDGLPRSVDPRQVSLFCAAWTAASIGNLAGEGASMIACHEVAGWRGIMEVSAGSADPVRFHSVGGTVFPVYHVIADICEFGATRIVTTASSDELAVQALLLRDENRSRMLVMNLTDTERSAAVEFPCSRVNVRRLDEDNAEEAMCHPEKWRKRAPDETRDCVSGLIELSLKPYAVVRLDTDY